MEDNWQVKIGIFQDQSIPNVEKKMLENARQNLYILKNWKKFKSENFPALKIF